MKTENNWKLIPHFSQIADTGDYDGCFELTNGKISLFTKDDDDDTMQDIVSILNQSEIEFFLDDTTHWELDQAKEHIKELESELSALKSAKEEVKSAEEIFRERTKNIKPDARLFLYSDVVFELMKAYASQFQSVQSKEKCIISDPKGLLVHEDMDIFAKEGYKVKVTEQTINFGYPHDKVQANKYLKIGEIYTVLKTEVGGWHTDVWLKEFPEISFNSVHFVPAEFQPVQSVKGEGEIRANIADLIPQDDWDKFIEWFENFYKIPFGVSQANEIREFIDEKLKFYKHSESKERWISVKDRLPEKMERVLCYNGFRVIEQSWCSYTNHDVDWFKKEFTHWMPLPEPPKS